MNTQVSVHPWSEEALFNKAKLYIEKMEELTADDWEYGLWSALALEFLARASLAHVSPLLLAEKNSWRNLTYALGKNPTAMGFSPKSVSTHEALSRLKELIAEFNEEKFNFCVQHIERRNREFHSGELAFVNLGTSEWLPRFYTACKVLLQSMDKELEDLITDPTIAMNLISEYNNTAASRVKHDIEAHKQVWLNKSSQEKHVASEQAAHLANRHDGHRVQCPACNSQALLQGDPSGTVVTEVIGDELKQRQTMLPASFACTACDLRISGYSNLSASGLGDAFTATYAYSVAEFYDLYTKDELEEEVNKILYEPDFNEY